MRSIAHYALASASLLALATPAFAQDKPADESDADSKKEIVVTGTSLRGVAPAGAEAIALSTEAIKATGATSSQSLLSSLPQMGNFNGTPFAGVSGARLTVNRINLRGLPQTTAGASPTLTLMDGHRFVGAGIQQSQADPSIIPPGLIDHVEVALGGGSSTYGADAIGGVINFIMKKDVDGFQLSGTHGFGNKYHSNNIDFLAGKKWDTGSVYVGYAYASNSSVRNADRSYERSGSYATGVYAPSDVQCTPGNVRIGTTTYAITNPTTLTLSDSNLCDRSKYAESFPAERRHSVMAGLRQELGDSVEVSLKGYYATRSNIFNSDTAGVLGFTVTKRSTDLLSSYVPVTVGNTSNQSVSGTFIGTTGPYNPTITKLSSWGITPSLTWQIGHDWVMKAFYKAGESHTTVHEPSVNTTALQAAATAGTFNPYDPAGAASATAVATALNWENYGIGISHMDNARVVFDGPAFHMSGGDVRVAVGAEYLRERYDGVANVTNTLQATVNTTTNPLAGYARNEKSAFAEVNIPLVGPDNSMSGIYSFGLSGAVRYDSYSDFGHVWSPSLGASYKPVEWINFRANWNKSFQAPSPADLAFTTPSLTYRAPTIYTQVPLLVNPNAGTSLGTLAGGGNVGASTAFGFLNIGGTASGLKPQRSKNFTIGFDMSPPVLPGLTLKLSYFNVVYKGGIGAPPHGSSASYWANFPANYAMNPTYNQIISILNAAGVSPTAQATALSAAGCSSTSCNIYVISDDRSQNFSNAKLSGLDLGFDYHQDTGFGSVFASFNGAYMLNFVTAPSDAAPYSANGVGNQNAAQTVQKFNYTMTVGATVGKNFRAQMKWNHSDGYDLLTPAGLGQTRVAAFNVFDFFASYELNQKNLPPITFSLGATNLFGTNPPVYYGKSGNAYGYAGSTLGRVVSLGASVKF